MFLKRTGREGLMSLLFSYQADIQEDIEKLSRVMLIVILNIRLTIDRKGRLNVSVVVDSVLFIVLMI